WAALWDRTDRCLAGSCAWAARSSARPCRVAGPDRAGPAPPMALRRKAPRASSRRGSDARIPLEAGILDELMIDDEGHGADGVSLVARQCAHGWHALQTAAPATGAFDARVACLAEL